MKFIDISREQNICVRGQKMLVNFRFYFSSSQPFRYNNSLLYAFVRPCHAKRDEKNTITKRFALNFRSFHRFLQ